MPEMRLLQMSLAGGVMIVVITVLRALTINKVPKKTFLLLWTAALLRPLVQSAGVGDVCPGESRSGAFL